MSYILTKNGEDKVEKFIADCAAKRKEILDADLDTVDETNLPTKDDIIADLDFIGIDSDGDYYNAWGVTDHRDLDIFLTLGTDFVVEE